MQLVFTDQYAHILFLINGLAILFYFGARKKKKQRAMKFGNYEALQKVAGRNFLKSSNIILVTRILALTTLIIGISNPVLLHEAPSSKADYVIAIDSSSSMLADDIDPTRFSAAKSLSSGFVSRLSNGTRVGVTSFAGGVTKEQELTVDKAEVRSSISDIDTGTKAGTAIGDAISVSTSMLLEVESNKRAMVLITDGRNNVGTSLNESVAFARRHNVTIYTFGLGTANRSVENFGTVAGVNASRAVYPNLDTAALEQIANQTGGKFKVASNREELKTGLFDIEKTTKEKDISRFFILAAAVLLLFEWVIGNTRYSILP
ncbi:MAG: VWA domain-containing protein [Candidatus Nanohaloarchaea archaeon]